MLNGSWSAPVPSVGRRGDGAGLFYPGKVHTVSSESEGGKTWLALAAVLAELERGEHVLYVDFEDDEGGIVGRLLNLQADPHVIAERFHYLRPEDPIGTGIHRDDLVGLLETYQPTLAVIDGVTEALTMHGLDPNSNSDVAKFGRLLPRLLAAQGAASVSLDHVTKSTEGRGRYSIGAVHKLNGLDGAAYVLENRNPFGVGITGRSTLKIGKDRPGQLRKQALPSAGGLFWFADLVLTSYAEGFGEVTVAAPSEQQSGDDFRPTIYMGRIMAVIEEHGPLSKRMIRAAVTGKAMTVDKALDRLILDGYLTESTPHTKLKTWAGDKT
ncbi:MAG TPA: AAA family ATPase [Nocardioides sp.]|nr:AAA family ATPase [Nocardioides sp.]